MSSSSSNSNSNSNSNNSHWIVSLQSLQQQQQQQQQQQASLRPMLINSVSVRSGDEDEDDYSVADDEILFTEEPKIPGGSRLVDVPQPSEWVGYFDAASLYPSSGKTKKRETDFFCSRREQKKAESREQAKEK